MMMGHRQNTFFLAAPEGYVHYTQTNLGNAYPQSAGALCVAMIIFLQSMSTLLLCLVCVYMKYFQEALLT